jgi:hypothetical protein
MRVSGSTGHHIDYFAHWTLTSQVLFYFDKSMDYVEEVQNLPFSCSDTFSHNIDHDFFLDLGIHFVVVFQIILNKIADCARCFVNFCY